MKEQMKVASRLCMLTVRGNSTPQQNRQGLEPAQQQQCCQEVHSNVRLSPKQQESEQQRSDSTATLQTGPAEDSHQAGLLHIMLRTAVEQRCPTAAEDLNCHPTVAHLYTSDRVHQLMHVALQQRCFETLHMLCGLPAAENLPAPLADRVFSTAAQHFSAAELEQLCKLRMVESVRAEAVAYILQESTFCPGAVNIILQYIPAAREMDASCLVDIIKTDLQHDEPAYALQYMQLPAVECFSSDQLMDLLEAAVRSAHWLLVEALCIKVPAAQTVDCAAAKVLLQTWLVAADSSYHMKQRSTYSRSLCFF